MAHNAVTGTWIVVPTYNERDNVAAFVDAVLEVVPLPSHDLSGGFKAWRRETLAAIDLESGYAQGYGFQVEMTWLAHRLGARITEVPITFRDRVAGTSKMSGAIALEALLMVIRLRASTIGRRKASARRSPT